MKRRRFIASLGAAVGLAGCLSGPRDADTATPTTTGSDTPTDRPTESETQTDPRKRFTVGTSTGDVNPLGVFVENDGSAARTLTLTITDTQSDEVRLKGTYTLEGHHTLAGEIQAPSSYDISVTLSATNTSIVETVEEGFFDTCNDYGTTVTIDGEGSLSAETYSTLVLCSTATVATTEDGG